MQKNKIKIFCTITIAKAIDETKNIHFLNKKKDGHFLSKSRKVLFKVNPDKKPRRVSICEFRNGRWLVVLNQYFFQANFEFLRKN